MKLSPYIKKKSGNNQGSSSLIILKILLGAKMMLEMRSLSAELCVTAVPLVFCCFLLPPLARAMVLCLCLWLLAYLVVPRLSKLLVATRRIVVSPRGTRAASL